jgi:hypothetical protein
MERRSGATAPPLWRAEAAEMWTTPTRCPQTRSDRRSLWLHDERRQGPDPVSN